MRDIRFAHAPAGAMHSKPVVDISQSAPVCSNEVSSA